MIRFTTRILLSAILLWSSATSFAQKTFKRCETAEVLERQLKTDPSMKGRMDQIEQFTNNFIGKSAAQRSSGTSAGNAVAATVTIPVVVHVLYNTAAQNVSDAMIQN